MTKVVVDMAAGDVLLFHSQLPHGTATNYTSSHRYYRMHQQPHKCTHSIAHSSLERCDL
jgi:ectoine hydroxylase-related dioxygenase (phytanoyl-CoA dioxygenase family)